MTELDILGLRTFPDVKQSVDQGLAELSSLKESVKPMVIRLPLLQENLAHHTTELNSIFSHLMDFQNNLTNKVTALTRTDPHSAVL